MSDMVTLLQRAAKKVTSSALWKKWIDGTPLSNDIACWMAEFAFEENEALRREVTELKSQLANRETANATARRFTAIWQQTPEWRNKLDVLAAQTVAPEEVTAALNYVAEAFSKAIPGPELDAAMVRYQEAKAVLRLYWPPDSIGSADAAAAILAAAYLAQKQEFNALKVTADSLERKLSDPNLIDCTDMLKAYHNNAALCAFVKRVASYFTMRALDDRRKTCRAKFTGEGGFDGERENALAVFERGKEYTVIGGTMGSCYTYLEIEGVPGRWNSVMFSFDWDTLPFTYGDSYIHGQEVKRGATE